MRKITIALLFVVFSATCVLANDATQPKKHKRHHKHKVTQTSAPTKAQAVENQPEQGDESGKNGRDMTLGEQKKEQHEEAEENAHEMSMKNQGMLIRTVSNDHEYSDEIDANLYHRTGGRSALEPTVPMMRDASGTAWLPDETASREVATKSPGWTWMFDGSMYLRMTAQDAFKSGNRGETTLSAPNWIHVMGSRRVSDRGLLGLRGMFSLEPATEGGDGYPLLFQTGESWHDRPLVDRQHPHDLFGEVAATYGQYIGGRSDYFAYLGLVGEPALGPPAYMNRPSAQHDPDAPLGHHWQDATHISYGVATMGFRVADVKADASVFNGHEPDDNHMAFDAISFNSYSGRLTYNPNANWSVQGSAGILDSPEQLKPGVDEYRYTASALYHVQKPTFGIWTSSLIWGMNQPRESFASAEGVQSTTPQHSVTVESDLERYNHAFYTRIEWAQKPAMDLAVPQFGDRLFNVGALTLGGAHDIARSKMVKLMAGAQGTLYSVSNDLKPEYGAQPFSFEVYLRLTPTSMF